MLSKLKGMLLTFVKPLVLSHIQDLSMLAPLFSGVLVNKASIPQAQADALALALVDVVETELAALINKI